MAQVQEIPIEKIVVGEHEQRIEILDDDIEILAASIGRVGLLYPLVVRAKDNEFVLVEGHRRLAACKNLGRKKVLCSVENIGIETAAEIAFAGNIFRKDLSPLEIASSIKDVLDSGTLDAEQLAAALHRSKDWVGRMIDVLDWPADVLLAIHQGWLSVSAGHNLALVTDDSYRDFLLKNGEEGGVTARTTAAWLQAWRSMQPPEQAVNAEPATPGRHNQPAVPQAPCICCGNVFRTDELSHVPACVKCIKLIREVGTSR